MGIRVFEFELSKYKIRGLVTRRFPQVLILLFVGFVALQSTSVGAQSSIKDEFAEAAEREKALVETIAEINTQLQTVKADLDQARRLVKKSELTIEETQEQKAFLGVRIDELKLELADAAIEGYVASDSVQSSDGEAETVTERLRADSLLSRIQKTRAELIAELALLLEEDRILDFSFTQATQIREDNLAIQVAKEAELLRQKEVQQELYDSVRVELDNLEAEAIASAELDDELRELILSRQRNTATTAGQLRWPITNPRITSSFGYRIHPIYGTSRLHAGIDVCPTGVSCSGAPIKSAGPGVVISSGWKGGYGNTVVIDHGGGITTLYAHMTTIYLSQGETVLGQETVGLVGASGNVTGAHLHFEVRKNGVAENPQSYLG